MTWLLYNIPTMVLFFALWIGIPAWLVAGTRTPTRSQLSRPSWPTCPPSSTTTPATGTLPDHGGDGPEATRTRRPDLTHPLRADLHHHALVVRAGQTQRR